MAKELEIWKDITGYEGLYQVSNLGKIKRLDSVVNTNILNVNKRFLKGRILKLNQKENYIKVNLCKDGKVKMYSVHRLVATAFLPNPNNYPVVNHINEDKTDNRVENLEWCTQEHNMNWNNVIKRKTGRKVIQLTKTGEYINTFLTGVDASIATNVNNRSISACCKGKQKTSGGYIWGFIDDYERIPFKVFDLTIYTLKPKN